MLLKSVSILLFSISYVRGQSKQKYNDEATVFLFRNTDVCGDPFADPVWIPVLDMCEIECDYASEYCVENEELQQQCKKLPDACVELLKQHMKLVSRQTRALADIRTAEMEAIKLSPDEKDILEPME